MRYYLLTAILFLSFLLKSQAPQSINYQAIARDAGGNIVTTSIGIKFQIFQGSVGGTLVYEEVNTANPSSAGIFNVGIGAGTPVSGTFSSIAWGSGPYFLQVSIDPAGGTSYTTIGSAQLVSVPYALFAEKAGNAVNYSAGNGISISSGSITNAAPDQTVTLNAAGITTVSGTYPNYTVNVDSPKLSYNSSTSELTVTQGGTSSTATLTGSGSNTISMIGTGIANVSPAGAGSNFTVNVQSPVITGQGSTMVMGTWPNFTITSTSTSYSAGAGISIASGSIINTAPNQTVSITGAGSTTVTGTYPNFTIAAPLPTVTPPPNFIGQGTATITTIANNHTVNVAPVGMNYTPATGILTYSPAPGINSLNISPNISFTNNILTVGSNTTTIGGTGLWSRPTATATILSNTSDYVGIGTNSPTEILQVQSGGNADISIVATGSNRATLNLGSNSNHFLGGISYHVGSNNMSFTSNSIQNRLFFDQSGRTAIGYTTTASELDVNGSMRLAGGKLFFGAVGGINSGYTGIYENASDLRFAVFRSGASATPFASAGNSYDAMVIKSNSGNVGIGIANPSNTFAIGNGTIEKFNINGSNGAMNFFDDQGSITFPQTGAAPVPMIYMFASGTSNAPRMVFAHSPAFPSYGLQYEDATDKFHFLSSGNPVLTADLTQNRVGVGIANPTNKLHVNGGVTITDGTQGAGKVLTSDAAGNATWKINKIAFSAGNHPTAGTTAALTNNTSVALILNSGASPFFLNDGGGYSAATGRFTAPVSGVYKFDASLVFAGAPSGYVTIKLKHNTGAQLGEQVGFFNTVGQNWYSGNLNITVHLNAGEYVFLEVYTGTGGGMSVYHDKSSFSGHLVYAD